MSANVELEEAREALKRACLFGAQEEIDAAEARIEDAREKQAAERLEEQRARIVEIITPWCRSKDHARLAAEKLVAAGFRNWDFVDAFQAAVLDSGREPRPEDGPDYHAEHAAWVSRQTRSVPNGE